MKYLGHIMKIFVSVTALNLSYWLLKTMRTLILRIIGWSKEPELYAHQKPFTIPVEQIIRLQLRFPRKAEATMKDSLKL